ncbi:hypothetical protein [Streptomyces violascens]|uniref:hypothetical protein n=1 Tax=Streptomyces violascens TaxID=67381 RepID=UPI003655A670
MLTCDDTSRWDARGPYSHRGGAVPASSRDSGGWDIARVTVPLLHRVTSALLALASVPLRREAVGDAELLVLRKENAVLRRQLKGPVRYEPLAPRRYQEMDCSLEPRTVTGQ